MNREKIETLIAGLRSLPDEGRPEEFTAVPGDGNFRWDYAEVINPLECGTVGCAVGLAYQLGLTKSVQLSQLAQALDILFCDARDIFMSPHTYFTEEEEDRLYKQGNDNLWKLVTPHMVADALEALLRGEDHHKKEAK